MASLPAAASNGIVNQLLIRKFLESNPGAYSEEKGGSVRNETTNKQPRDSATYVRHGLYPPKNRLIPLSYSRSQLKRTYIVVCQLATARPYEKSSSYCCSTVCTVNNSLFAILLRTYALTLLISFPPKAPRHDRDRQQLGNGIKHFSPSFLHPPSSASTWFPSIDVFIVHERVLTCCSEMPSRAHQSRSWWWEPRRGNPEDGCRGGLDRIR